MLTASSAPNDDRHGKITTSIRLSRYTENGLSSSGVDHFQGPKLLNTFKFIKAVSDTVFEMINAVYCDKL